MTIVQHVTPSTFTSLKNGSQAFLVIKCKKQPTIDDKMLIMEVTEPGEDTKPEITGNELPIMAVTCVCTDGLMKNYYAVGFHLPDMAAAVLKEPVHNISQQGAQC
jgi:hypothetical protein